MNLRTCDNCGVAFMVPPTKREQTMCANCEEKFDDLATRGARELELDDLGRAFNVESLDAETPPAPASAPTTTPELETAPTEPAPAHDGELAPALEGELDDELVAATSAELAPTSADVAGDDDDELATRAREEHMALPVFGGPGASTTDQLVIASKIGLAAAAAQGAPAEALERAARQAAAAGAVFDQKTKLQIAIERTAVLAASLVCVGEYQEHADVDPVVCVTAESWDALQESLTIWQETLAQFERAKQAHDEIIQRRPGDSTS